MESKPGRLVVHNENFSSPKNSVVRFFLCLIFFVLESVKLATESEHVGPEEIRKRSNCLVSRINIRQKIFRGDTPTQRQQPNIHFRANHEQSAPLQQQQADWKCCAFFVGCVLSVGQ